MMRTSRLVTALFAIVWLWAVTGDAFGQTTWREFVSKEDRFGANFPGEPVVTHITWTSDTVRSCPDGYIPSPTAPPGIR